MPFLFITKKRLVWCIHIAAFLFSALVLAVSAFSHYRAIASAWTSRTEYTLNQIYLDEGYIVVVRYFRSEIWLPVPFAYAIGEPFNINSVIDGFGRGRVDNKHGFLSIAYWATISMDGATVASLTAVPLRTVLFFPVAWMCGFYLVRWRRHIRARCAEKQALRRAVR